MKKQLMVGLLSAGLVVAMLPGLTVAKDDGKSDCKKDGWTDWVTDDGSPFTDQAECVAYVAEGGSLVLPDPPDPSNSFKTGCEGYGGTYAEDPHAAENHPLVAPVCLWMEGVAPAILFAAQVDPDLYEACWAIDTALSPFFSVEVNPDYLGCLVN